MTVTEGKSEQVEVNIEEIMQQIREQVLAKRAALSPEGTAPVRAHGKRFPPEFYEHLYQAALAYDQLNVAPAVSKNSTPLIGPLLHWLRSQFHELVVFYVNRFAAQQIAVNNHLLQAVNILSEELEALPEEGQRQE